MAIVSTTKPRMGSTRGARYRLSSILPCVGRRFPGQEAWGPRDTGEQWSICGATKLPIATAGFIRSIRDRPRRPSCCRASAARLASFSTCSRASDDDRVLLLLDLGLLIFLRRDRRLA